MTRSLSRFVPHALALAILAGCALASAGVTRAVPLPGGDQYNSPGFIVRHAWVKFAYIAAHSFGGEPSRSEENARLARFFELNRLITDGERIAGDPETAPQDAAVMRAQLAEWRDERTHIENGVEITLEGRLTATVKELGLTRNVGANIVWPPVSIEFEDTPAVLVRSPRAEIRRESERLLKGDLPIERVQSIETRAERDGETSALVVHISGIAMYPAIIPPSDDYGLTLQYIAHEWIHHYLYFTPLGRRYYSNGDLTTLNETVANIAGDEIGDIMLQRYPLPDPQAAISGDAAPTQPAGEAIDFVAEMRELRRNVEGLLAEGRIDEAEQLMESKREYLAQHGYYIRKINQAYFAFHGAYADTAGSIDPIGPKLEDLRARSADVTSFMRAAREITSTAALDALLQPR